MQRASLSSRRCRNVRAGFRDDESEIKENKRKRAEIRNKLGNE